MARVELDVFSGRPNPTWQLADVDARRLAELVVGLARVPGSAPQPPALGYRGFLVALPGGRYRVWGPHVFAPDDHRADPARTVERFLADRLPAEHGDLRSLIESEATLG